jgi:MFS family permease
MGNAVAVVGALIQASAYSVPQMIVGRLFTGFAIGSISSSVPSYLNECGSSIHDRGPANAINAMFLIGGIPVAYCRSWKIFQMAWPADLG